VGRRNHSSQRRVSTGFITVCLWNAGPLSSSWPATCIRRLLGRGGPPIVAGVGIAVFLRVMVPIWTTEIGVTSDRVIVKRRFLARHTDEIQLSAIEEINVDQGLFGRLLDFGRIHCRAQATTMWTSLPSPARCASEGPYSKHWKLCVPRQYLRDHQERHFSARSDRRSTIEVSAVAVRIEWGRDP
jgi:hypothetical protein